MHDYLGKPIIIIGFGRSGTSLVADIVMQHFELAFISNYNAKFFKSSTINLVRHFFDNGLWQLKGQKKQINRVPILNRYTFKPSEAYAFLNNLTGRDFARNFLFNIEAGQTERERIRKGFGKLVRYQGKRRLIFKITGPSRLGYLNSIFPDAKYILVKRNPFRISDRSLGLASIRTGKQHYHGREMAFIVTMKLSLCMITQQVQNLLQRCNTLK